MKKRMGHYLWERLQKEEGDDISMQCWKEHNPKTNKMDSKMDVVMAALEIHSSSPPMGQYTGVVLDPTRVFLRNMLGAHGF